MLLDGAEDFELADRMLAVGIPTGVHSDVVYPWNGDRLNSNAMALAAKHDVWLLRRAPRVVRDRSRASSFSSRLGL